MIINIVKIVIDIFKLMFSGISTLLPHKNGNDGIIISDNEDVEVSGNEINGRNVKIEKNKNSKVSDNKWI